MRREPNPRNALDYPTISDDLWVIWSSNGKPWPAADRHLAYMGKRRDIMRDYALFTVEAGSAETFATEAQARTFLAEHEAKRPAPYGGITVSTVAEMKRRCGYTPAVRMIIEICPNEPRASACLTDGREVSADSEVAEALADCRASGDAQPACEYVRNELGVEFRIIARNESGEYENRLATAAEKAATARAIYFESESDFDDERTAETYLIWDAAASAESEGE